MTPWITAFAEAVAGRRLDRLDSVVQSAYRAGADRSDLLVALEVAKVLAEVPRPVLADAYASIHAWHWIAARRRAAHSALAVQVP